jgi:hypothetical protein
MRNGIQKDTGEQSVTDIIILIIVQASAIWCQEHCPENALLFHFYPVAFGTKMTIKSRAVINDCIM